MPSTSTCFSAGSSPAAAGWKVLDSSNSLPAALPRLRLLAMVFSMEGTMLVRITEVSSPRGLRSTTALRRGSSSAMPRFSIHLGLMKE